MIPDRLQYFLEHFWIGGKCMKHIDLLWSICEANLLWRICDGSNWMNNDMNRLIDGINRLLIAFFCYQLHDRLINNINLLIH